MLLRRYIVWTRHKADRLLGKDEAGITTLSNIESAIKAGHRDYLDGREDEPSPNFNPRRNQRKDAGRSETVPKQQYLLLVCYQGGRSYVDRDLMTLLLYRR